MKNKNTILHFMVFRQETTRMYTGVMTVQAILDCTDAAINKEGQDETGYQHIAGEDRAMKFARYLKEHPKPLVPTALLLSYRNTFANEADSYGRVTVEIPESEKLWVIDGQHRIAGFRTAIYELGIERLRDYCLPVVIIEKIGLDEEAFQFRKLNDTSKNERTDKYLGSAWRDWATKAAAITKALNTNKQSPWYGSIQMADENKKDKHVVKEFTVKQSLKDLGVNKAFKKNSSQEVTQILMEYWLAWKDLAPDGFKYPDKYMLMKSAGLNICHMLLVVILKETSQSVMLAMKAKDFKILLKQLAEPPAPINYRRASAGGVEDEEEEELDDTDFLSAQFWRSDSFRGAAVVGSSKGHKLIRDAMAARLFPPDKEV